MMSNRFRIAGWITAGFLVAITLGLGYLYLFEKRESLRRLAELRRLSDEGIMDVPVVAPSSQLAQTSPPKEEGIAVVSQSAEAVLRRPDSLMLDNIDRQLDQQAMQLAARIRTADSNDVETLKNELRAVTVKQFEHRQKLREQELQSLTQRIESLQTKNLQRRNHQAEIIASRVNDLLKTAPETGWDDPDVSPESPTTETTTDISSNAREVAAPEKSDPFSGKRRSESTFNGVTMSEWMRQLAHERNEEKVAEAILAMNYLADDAEPGELVRTVLRTIRRYGSRLEYPPSMRQNAVTNLINRGAMLLLTTLPSDIVVDEIIAELKALREQPSDPQPTHDFLRNYFGSLRNQIIPDMLFSAQEKLAFTFPSDRLKASLTKLRSEVRRKSRSIIGELIVTGYSNEESLEWVTACAGLIVQISGQTISTYPELVPFVEREFERLIASPPTIATTSRSGGSYAAILLGEIGLRIPEILDYATKQLQIEFPSNQPNLGNDRQIFATFDDALNCLTAIAPHSAAAINILTEELTRNWKQIDSYIEDRKALKDGRTKVIREMVTENSFRLSVLLSDRIIRALGKIGLPATVSIPLLQQIKESDASQYCIIGPNGNPANQISEIGPNGRQFFRPQNLRDVSQQVIETIQEAKPRTGPERLGVGDEDSSSKNPNVDIKSNEGE